MEWPRQWKMGMIFGTWNVKSFCRAESLKTVASELIRYTLDLVAVQEFKWFKGGSQTAEDYTCFLWK
jgi:hypothetical protein